MPPIVPPDARGQPGAGCTLARVTILDDARAGMDPDIRPQDDLFGHVNGRWLATAEIPADRSTWGAFVELADEAEAAGPRRSSRSCASAARGTDGPGRTPRRSATSTPASWTRSAVEALGAAPLQPTTSRRSPR